MYTIIASTNRNHSYSARVAKYYQTLLESHDIKAELIDLNTLPPDYIVSCLYENAGTHPEFNKIREKVKYTTKFVFVIPEYNGSFPGILKAFIDGLEYPGSMKGKKAGLIGISSGDQGSALSMSHFSDILNYLGCHVLAAKPRLAGIERNFSFKEADFSAALYHQLLDEHVQKLIDF